MLRSRGKYVLLVVGILLRISTFVFLAPDNNDHHSEVLDYLVKFHTFPLVEAVHEGHNPPLYYLLTAPILALTGSLKATQFFSLVCSIATLCVLFRLIYHTGLLQDPRAQFYSFLLLCTLPQFIMFSLYVSNDTLATLLGAILAVQVWRYIQSPSWKQLFLLGLVEALGLLTKTTFLGAVPLLLTLVYIFPREKRHGWNGLLRADVFLILALLGCYKFADNAIRYGDPFHNNMDLDQDWHLRQMASYRGFWSFADVNLGRLIVSPVVSHTTDGSYPVLLYGTFWYQHIRESSFDAMNSGLRTRYLGSLIFVLALVPTFVFLRGFVKLARDLPRSIFRFDPAQPEDRRRLAASTLALTIPIGITLLGLSGLQYHEWSIFQGRLLFPWLSGGILAFAAGMPAPGGAFAKILQVSMLALTVLFVIYLSSEIIFALRLP